MLYNMYQVFNRRPGRVCVCVVSEVVVGLRTDGIRGKSQLHQIQQRRVQEVRLKYYLVSRLFFFFFCYLLFLLNSHKQKRFVCPNQTQKQHDGMFHLLFL